MDTKNITIPTSTSTPVDQAELLRMIESFHQHLANENYHFDQLEKMTHTSRKKISDIEERISEMYTMLYNGMGIYFGNSTYLGATEAFIDWVWVNEEMDLRKMTNTSWSIFFVMDFDLDGLFEIWSYPYNNVRIQKVPLEMVLEMKEVYDSNPNIQAMVKVLQGHHP